jgi:signal transduction histidine kinase
MVSKPHIQLEALHGLARALAGGEFRARAVLDRACAAVAEGFGFERVGIVRFVAESSTLIPFAAHGLTRDELGALPTALPIGRFSAFQTALATGRATFVEHPAAERAVPEEIIRGFGIGSFVIVPLVSDARCFGFLTCDERGGSFQLDEAELDLLTTFGTLIAAFLERAIAHSELRRLNELKSQFAALASHELRTPVAAVYGAIRTLDEREGTLSTEQRVELRAVLSHQAQRLFELVENLLDLSRLEADSLRIVPTEVDVRERLAELIRATCDRPDEVVLDVDPELRVVVDQQALDRIVSNLLVNAARHGAPPIRVSAGTAGRQLVITIEDRGSGIEPEFASTIFERFTRGSTSSSEGAGLGLAIARSYARAHGGTISYAPVKPHGASFSLTLPAQESLTDL